MTLALLKAMNISLAQQARIIRRLEQKNRAAAANNRRFLKKLKKSEQTESTKASIALVSEQMAAHNTARADLYRGRTYTTRTARRSAHLAYNFWRGTPYNRVEMRCWSPPDWAEIERLVKLHTVTTDGVTGGEDIRVAMQLFAQWKDEVGAWMPPPPKPPQPRPSNWIKAQVWRWMSKDWYEKTKDDPGAF